jgi:NADPH-dependent glutamate synthase beta subunit-like oxidoreductase
MGGWAPVAVLKGADGRATALRVAQCEAKMVGRLDIKMIEGTEKDLPADLIVSAIGQAVDFTGLEESQQSGKGPSPPTRTTRCRASRACSPGGDVIRPHLLTTAIGHGAIAADGIDQFLAGEEQPAPPQDRRALAST